ncbi:MAG: ATP-dependent protease [Gemmatimonadales bacterium]|nr:MAG: ATP-dependent protease [Gemmatimonadales bacterium]
MPGGVGQVMRRLPLFPLPVVLLPGTAMPLHIFEPRYRQMVARCLEFDRRFGLVYHDPDRLGPFEMEPGRVGTVAEIGEFRALPDGRSLLIARGEVRFRLEDGIESDTPYFEGLVEEVEDEPPRDVEELMDRRQRSVDLLSAVLDRLDAEAAVEVREALRIDPAQETSFQLAARVRVDPAWLQTLLETTDEARRLDRLDLLLSQALAGGGEVPEDGGGAEE